MLHHRSAACKNSFCRTCVRFQRPTEEKSTERLKALSDLEGTCSGGEFIVSKAGETLRYANKTSKSGIMVYIERATHGKSSGLCWSVNVRRSMFVQGASSN